jgi:polysaccharide deacetylase family protein (PEP-CTERM system associated)
VTPGPLLASFDIEDWFHAENLKPSLGGADWNTLESRVERNTHELLDILAQAHAKATFFVLGWIARRHPQLVRYIVAAGHEVASHTDMHHQLHTLSRSELVADLARARDSLEQVTGRRVLGVRAPAFTITDQALDCLAEARYWYDSSFYAFRMHDRYGRLETRIDPEQPVFEVRPGLLELPMTRCVIGPVALPWAGGGYFRLIPYRLYRWGVARELESRPFMFYFHPWELDAEEVPPPNLPRAMKFRAYVGRHRMRGHLRRLLLDFGSARIDDTLRAMGYTPPSPG